MKDALIAQVLAEVERRQRCACLIGRQPTRDLGWNYVTQGEFQAVVIGSLSAYELLQMPDEICVEALLTGKPVFVCEEGLEYRRHAKTANRALYSQLLTAERRLKQLGMQFLRENTSKILTAEEVRRRLQSGERIEGRLTPLARDILEGKL